MTDETTFHLLVFAHSAKTAAGAERSLLDLLHVFAARPMLVTVVTPSEGAFADAARKLGQNVVALDVVMPQITWQSLWWCGPVIEVGGEAKNPTRIRDIVERLVEVLGERFDVVYTNTSVSPLGAFFAARIHKPHVWHLREFVDLDFGWRFAIGKTGCHRFISTMSTRVIAVSKMLQQHLVPTIPAEQIAIIENGPLSGKWLESPQRSTLADPQTLRLVVLGNITPHKGQRDAIEAVAKLADSSKVFELHLYGGEVNSEYGLELQELAQKLKVSGRVHFHGSVDDPRRTLLENDIALICSKSEAFGRVTVEAMATEMPVIGSAAGATPEILKAGETGLLYLPGDSVDLANQLRTLAEDSALRQRLAKQAREEAMRRYTTEIYARRVIAVLEEAAERGTQKDRLDPELLELLMLNVAHCITQHSSQMEIELYRRLSQQSWSWWGFKGIRWLKEWLPWSS